MDLAILAPDTGTAPNIMKFVVDSLVVYALIVSAVHFANFFLYFQEKKKKIPLWPAIEYVWNKREKRSWSADRG